MSYSQEFEKSRENLGPNIVTYNHKSWLGTLTIRHVATRGVGGIWRSSMIIDCTVPRMKVTLRYVTDPTGEQYLTLPSISKYNLLMYTFSQNTHTLRFLEYATNNTATWTLNRYVDERNRTQYSISTATFYSPPPPPPIRDLTVGSYVPPPALPRTTEANNIQYLSLPNSVREAAVTGNYNKVTLPEFVATAQIARGVVATMTRTPVTVIEVSEPDPSAVEQTVAAMINEASNKAYSATELSVVNGTVRAATMMLTRTTPGATQLYDTLDAIDSLKNASNTGSDPQLPVFPPVEVRPPGSTISLPVVPAAPRITFPPIPKGPPSSYYGWETIPLNPYAELGLSNGLSNGFVRVWIQPKFSRGSLLILATQARTRPFPWSVTYFIVNKDKSTETLASNMVIGVRDVDTPMITTSIIVPDSAKPCLVHAPAFSHAQLAAKIAASSTIDSLSLLIEDFSKTFYVVANSAGTFTSGGDTLYRISFYTSLTYTENSPLLNLLFNMFGAANTLARSDVRLRMSLKNPTTNEIYDSTDCIIGRYVSIPLGGFELHFGVGNSPIPTGLAAFMTKIMSGNKNMFLTISNR